MLHVGGDMSMRSGRAGGVLALAILLSAAEGCATRPSVEPRPGGIVMRSARIGWYLKKVMAKQDPDTLLADDATICRVEPSRFRTITVGTLLRCNWQ